MVRPLFLFELTSVGEAPGCGSCAVPWFETNGFSGFPGKGLWSISSIACSLWVVHCLPSTSLAARFEDMFLLWLLVDEAVLCVVLERFPLVIMLVEIIFQTQIIRRASLSFSSLLPARFSFSFPAVYRVSPPCSSSTFTSFFSLVYGCSVCVCVKLCLRMVPITLPAFGSKKVAYLCWLCVLSVSS